ncbi:MAG: hypothetical protein ACXVSL_20915, partial [Solirubrobacteraceae bacterium]
MQLSDEAAVDPPYSRIANSGRDFDRRAAGGRPAGRSRSGPGAGLAASARLSLISIAGPAVGPSLVSSEAAAFEPVLAGWMLMRWTRNDLAMTTHTSTSN